MYAFLRVILAQAAMLRIRLISPKPEGDLHSLHASVNP